MFHYWELETHSLNFNIVAKRSRNSDLKNHITISCFQPDGITVTVHLIDRRAALPQSGSTTVWKLLSSLEYAQ
jgi:hypothetical protein